MSSVPIFSPWGFPSPASVKGLPAANCMSQPDSFNPIKSDQDSMKGSEERDKLPYRCSSPAIPNPSTLLDLPVDPESGPPLCAGCRLRIVDKFYFCAVRAKWHSACLKCSDCGVELANQLSCFERDGNIYCKDDYIRIYSNKRQCARCLLEIKTSDLVMRARHCLFHLDCFRCATCETLLQKGDLFGMFEEVLYCRIHFENISSSTTQNPILHQPIPGQRHSPISEHSYVPPHSPIHPGIGYPFLCTIPGGGPGEPPWFPGSPCPVEYGISDVPYDNNNEPFLKKRRGRKKRKVDSFAVMNGYLDAGYPPGMEGQSGQGKSKRARTSFKHHQLRIMKGHFQINQNPDSRELKMLSQKTGLDKKVLQVWFQNARAKWRRMNATSGPSLGGSGAAGGATDTSSSETGLSSMQDDADTIGLNP